MTLLDEEEINKPKKKNKLRSYIIILIAILSVLCIGIIVLLLYIVKNPNEDGVYIGDKYYPNLEKIFDINQDENGEKTIYIPIKEFASQSNLSLGYIGYTGEYNPKNEDESKCYVLKEKYEVTIFTEDSDIIYKLNLQSKNAEYETYKIDSKVFKNNDQLYTSLDGIEKAFNIKISFEGKESNKIKIKSIDDIIKEKEENLKNIANKEYGELTSVTTNFNDAKTVLENMIIVKNKNNQYGLVKTDKNPSFILEPKYDSISYICQSESFLVSSDKKYGIFSKEGKKKIGILYDEIISMGQDYGFYIVKLDDNYGVVDGNGKIIIHPENEEIGIDIEPFSYNNIKNGYILLNKLIPVKKDGLWAFYNTDGKLLTNKEKFYKNIGCTNIKGEKNSYALLEIPECNLVVVQDNDEKFSFVNTDGDDTILPVVFDRIYIKVVDGQKKYLMQRNEKEYDVIEVLKRKSEK